MTQEDVLFLSSEEKEALLVFSSWATHQSPAVTGQFLDAVQCIEDVAHGKPVERDRAVEAARCLAHLARQSGNMLIAALYEEIARDLIPLALDDSPSA